ncbi:MAG TPA: glyoxalase [Aliiroseovarius sp.]|nr:glyoxalase [Aliiroseovarius sp.]
MSVPVLDAVGVTARDMAASVAFYRALGFAFPRFGPDDQHVEAITEPGRVRLMIDAASLAENLIGEAPRPGNGAAFALLFEAPAAVDAAARAGAAAGGRIVAEPWDAFWGQRYATVADPDGYRVDLFAPLEG